MDMVTPAGFRDVLAQEAAERERLARLEERAISAKPADFSEQIG